MRRCAQLSRWSLSSQRRSVSARYQAPKSAQDECIDLRVCNRQNFDVRLDVLGEMCVDGDPNTFTARDRAVLAALAMCPGSTITADRLAEAVWGEDRPASWNKVIPGCVMRLRRTLGASAIETTRNGYRLVLEADAIDVRRFERLAAQGHELLEGGEPGRAAELLGEALATWRGPAFVDLEEWEPRLVEARRLEEIRLDAQEEFVEACERAGRHFGVLAMAQSLVAEMPFRERRWALLAGAQYRAGRQTDALRTLQRAREMLASELGVDPGPGLVDLEQAILRHDRALGVKNDVSPFDEPIDGSSTRSRSAALSLRPPRRPNLPTPLTPLIDRDGRLVTAGKLLEDHRLVTLTGTGGVGKTRLSIELGWAFAEQFHSGVWLVELAPVTTADSVFAAVASTLSIPPQHSLSVIESIVDWFRGRELLLIVDNCEHVLEPIRQLMTEILANCPTVKVLSTSREPLGIAGEHLYRVNVLKPLEEGVGLFLERAAASDGLFVWSDADRAVVGDICARLDGLPLAIELAAARVRSMAPVDLLARLDEWFPLLGTTGRDDRHGTLWATVDWSYQLLTEHERTTFDRLSAFAGGFDLRASEVVCADGSISPSDVLNSLTGLVDKSMVVAERSSDGTRYRVLETLRQFGEAQLRAHGSTAAVRERHLRHYVDVAEQADNVLHSSRQIDGTSTFDTEWNNMRAAHEWATATCNMPMAERLLRSTRVHALTQMRREHGDWAERTIALGTATHPASPDTYAQGAYWAFSVENYSRTAELLRRGIDLAVSIDDPSAALCLTYAGRNQYPRVPDPFAHLEIAATKLDLDREWWVLSYLANAAGQFESPSESDHVSRLVGAAERIGAPFLTAAALSVLGRLAIVQQRPDYARALDLYSQALGPARQCGDVIAGECLSSIALASVGLGADSASEACRVALVSVHGVRCWFLVWCVMESIGLALALRDRAEAAAVVIGNLEAQHPAFGPVSMGREIGFRDRILEIVRAHADVETWMSRGAAMDRYQIVEYALAELGEMHYEGKSS